MINEVFFQEDFSKLVKQLNLNEEELSSFFEGSLNKDFRLKRGVFYTDSLISKYMLERVFNFLEKNLDLEKLKKLRILDPSCGSGSFLLSGFKILKLLYKKLGDKRSEQEIDRWIIENNLYGCDIDKRAIEIVGFRFELLTNLSNLNMNIYNQDFILEFNEKDFDLIIGNPPYIGEKGNKELFNKLNNSLIYENFYEKGMDYFYFFIEKSIQILKENGILSFLTTNYWVKADCAKKLRKEVYQKSIFLEVLDFNQFKPFRDAKGQHNMIFTIQKTKKNKEFEYIKLNCTKGKIENILNLIRNKDLNNLIIKTCSSDTIKDKDGLFLFLDKKVYNIIKKISFSSDKCLSDFAKINQGVVSGADKVNKKNIKFLKNIKLNDGIFVLKESEAIKKELESDLLKPFFKTSDIAQYKTSETSKTRLIYTNKSLKIEEYLKIKEHLSLYKEILKQKRESQIGMIPWYSLHWPRKKSIFENEKIVVPQRAKRNIFGYNEIDWYASADVYFITDFKIDAKYLLGILNSKLMYFWLYNKGKRKGEYLEMYQKPLTRIPIIICDEKTKNNLKELVNEQIRLDRPSEEIQSKIDKIVEKIYGLTSQESSFIRKFYFK